MPLAGYKHSLAARLAMSAAKTGVPFTAQRKEQHGEMQRELHRTERYRKIMSAVKKGKPAPMDSRVGASEKNWRAKDWWFIKNQVHYKFRSLNKFVRDNKHLFTEDELTEYKNDGRLAPVYRATVMLRNLLLIKKNGVPAVPTHEWNGWTIGDKWAQGFYDDKEGESK